MGAHEEATRYDDATLAGASSANHDAGQAVTEDRKHVEASAASRSEASTAVAASAYHHGLVRNQASYLSCAPWVATHPLIAAHSVAGRVAEKGIGSGGTHRTRAGSIAA